jgi:hypothetical protein
MKINNNYSNNIPLSYKFNLPVNNELKDKQLIDLQTNDLLNKQSNESIKIRDNQLNENYFNYNKQLNNQIKEKNELKEYTPIDISI